MAILLDFEKVREDSREVEHRFGHPTTCRHLVIDKASQEGRPVDGTANHSHMAVVVKILRLWRERTTWPEWGTYAA
jgi:hypothetical protein